MPPGDSVAHAAWHVAGVQNPVVWTEGEGVHVSDLVVWAEGEGIYVSDLVWL